MSTPWPRSPNITANRKGKVMMVYGAGDKEAGITRGEGGVAGGTTRVKHVMIYSTSQQGDNG